MPTVFADTGYWIALSSPRDDLAGAVAAIEPRVAASTIVTTDWVLSEYLAFVSGMGPLARAVASARVRLLLLDGRVEVLHASHEQFLRGLELYEARTDKGYSLVDCISMSVMRELGISAALTGDRHFEQEGFEVLLR